jgi:hypothetical protein
MVVAATLVALTACNVIEPLDPSLDARFLTTVGDDDHGVTLAGGPDDVTVTAPASNTGVDTRIVVWRRADPVAADQSVCASWTDPPDQANHQAGVALRVRPTDGGASAVTVTRNIFWGAFWGFNVHVWDGNRSPAIIKIAGFELPAAVRRGGDPVPVTAPFPWRLCARIVGDVLTFKVWAADIPEPAWGDPLYGGSVTLPPGWEASGHAGGYVGHVPPGSSFTLTDLTVAPVAPANAAASAAPPRAPTAIAQAP